MGKNPLTPFRVKFTLTTHVILHLHYKFSRCV